MSGRFAGRTNEVFMAGDDDILNALESLDDRDLSQEGYNQFATQLFLSLSHDNAESSGNSLLTNI